jgi:hypothetical protein
MLVGSGFSSWVRIHQNVHKMYYSTVQNGGFVSERILNDSPLKCQRGRPIIIALSIDYEH